MAPPKVPAPILPPAMLPLEVPSVAPVPSMTRTTVTTPPAPILASAVPPLVAPVLNMTRTTVMNPPAPILASAVPPLVAPVPSMTETTVMTPPAPILAPTLGQLPVASNPMLSAGEIEQRVVKKDKMHPGPSLTAQYSVLTWSVAHAHILFRNLCA